MSKHANIARSRDEIEQVLRQAGPTTPVVSVLTNGLSPAAARQIPSAQAGLNAAAPLLADLDNRPDTTYTRFREFRLNGERRGYERPYFAKRGKLCAAALALWLGEERYRDAVHDYLWDICEETTWVIPACEPQLVDLFNVGTAFTLAEVTSVLDDQLSPEVTHRVRQEIETRVMTPYLPLHNTFWWYKGANNWNGVCNGGVGSVFLLLEPNVRRLAEALEYVLEGLEHYFAVAFEEDGGSTEGVGYWQYGLSNVIPFAEMLRHRTAGALDILGTERLRAIAGYPRRMMLSPGHYASFSDSEEKTNFEPGLVAKLAERTGVSELLDIIAEPVEIQISFRQIPFWRNIAWWNGERPSYVQLGDDWQQAVGVARLVSETAQGAPVTLVAKAGHNAENHNQNDVGSFILHVDGESLLCDPGRGLYSRAYFSAQRYENIFNNSYGHSVPRIGGQLQSTGAQYRGEISDYAASGPAKSVTISFAGAYGIPGLERLERTLRLQGGELTIEDRFAFSGAPLPVEEAFVTWAEVTVSGATARVAGKKHSLELTIATPAEAGWQIEVLKEQSEANAFAVPLKRLSFTLPTAAQAAARVVARIVS